MEERLAERKAARKLKQEEEEAKGLAQRYPEAPRPHPKDEALPVRPLNFFIMLDIHIDFVFCERIHFGYQ